jgi:uncharacterized membrane protein
MKSLLELVKTTAMGGFFVLLPVLILLLLLEEVFGLVVAMATPVADLLLPESLIEALNAPVLIAVVLILSLSLAIGIAMRMRMGQRVGTLLERTVLERLPAYPAVRHLTRSLGGGGASRSFEPMLLANADGSRQIAYLIERHDDGNATVLLPVAPTPFGGRIRVVPLDRLQPLNASLAEVTAVVTHWGVGLGGLVAPSGSGHAHSAADTKSSES